MTYTIITVPGTKIEKIQAVTAEAAVRSEMCWYKTGTIFVAINENDQAEYFRKTHIDDAVTGYADLVKETTIS